MTSSTDDDLVAEALRLSEAATPGPWVKRGAWIDGAGYDEVLGSCPVECMNYCYGGYAKPEWDRESDLDFIVASRSLVPALAARLVAAEAALADAPSRRNFEIAKDQRDIFAKRCDKLRAQLADANKRIEELEQRTLGDLMVESGLRARGRDALAGFVYKLPDDDDDNYIGGIEEMTADQPAIHEAIADAIKADREQNPPTSREWEAGNRFAESIARESAAVPSVPGLSVCRAQLAAIRELCDQRTLSEMDGYENPIYAWELLPILDDAGCRCGHLRLTHPGCGCDIPCVAVLDGVPGTTQQRIEGNEADLR